MRIPLHFAKLDCVFLTIFLSLVFSDGYGTPVDSAPTFNTPLMMEQVLPDGMSVKLRFDRDSYEQLKHLGAVVLSNFILEAGRTVDLELEQFTVFNDQSSFVAGTPNGDKEIPPPDIALFRGTVRGDETSRVFLGFSPHCTNGYIRTAEKMYYLSPDKSSIRDGLFTGVYICPEEALPVPTGPPAMCQGQIVASSSPSRSPSPEQPDPGEQKNTMYIVDIAMDGAYSYYYDFWFRHPDAAQAYLVELAGAASDIYQRDFNTKLWLTYTRVWTSQDPYTSTGDSLELSNFRTYWNNYMGGVDRDFAAKISGSFPGGIAWLDALCNPDIGYMIAGISTGSFPNPVSPGDPWWDLLVVTHEWGHNIGSRHTHCYIPPIDLCYNSEPGCWSGPVFCPRGTIMSYCHVCTSDGSRNIDPWFHPRVITNVVDNLDECDCLNFARDPVYVDAANVWIENGSIGMPWNTIAEGIRGVVPGGTIRIVPAHYPESLHIREHALLEKYGLGDVHIGPQKF